MIWNDRSAPVVVMKGEFMTVLLPTALADNFITIRAKRVE
jgi:hypothetical protein